MKHRSPLLTLAAVAVAFIIMFTVNMLVSPPGGSSAEPVGPSAAPASSGPAQQTTSAVATSSASASEINQAKKPAGLYRARGSKTTVGWIVLEDRSQVGLQTAGADSAAAPELNPESPQVTANGENLDAEPINGDEDL
jgi:hypothetical protein